MDTAENTEPSACTGAANKKQQFLCLGTQNIRELKAPRAVNVRLSLSTGKSAERLF